MMIRKIVALWAMVVGMSVWAEVDPVEGPMLTLGAQGKLVMVNALGSNGQCMMCPALEVAAKKIRNILMITTEVKCGEWKLSTAKESFEAAGGSVVVFVVKDNTLPLSLIAMESKWGVVNAKDLNESQLEKEVIRVSTVLLGAASSKYPASTMRPVFSLADLDKAGNLITIDSLMAIFPNLEMVGIKQFQSMSYRDACYEGIAPEPKNELERKIAAEVKAQLAEEAAKKSEKKPAKK